MPEQQNTQHPNLMSMARFPRASKYDPRWVLDNEMGPNALWLAEFLCEALELTPGMRVLDLGCGKAISSIFLAQEYNVQVWATDLWISASDNAERIRAAGLDEGIFPIHADARNLPFADAFFDAIVSIDAFEYFGTDASFLPSMIRVLKPGRQIGIINAGVLEEMDTLPAEWPADFCAFHTSQWWRRHWAIGRCVEVESADYLPDGRDLWLRWHEITQATDDEYLTSPAGENLGFNRVIARRLA